MTVPESTFTGARAFCPRPERWHSPDIQATESEVAMLVAALVRATQPDQVVETGTYLGHTAYLIGQTLDLSGHGHLTTLERDPELAEQARSLCVGLPVTVVTGDTLEFTPSSPIDFAWFDSGPDIRADEFRRLHPHMHGQTVVGFHDCGPQHSVWGQVMELIQDGLLERPLLIHSPRGVCFANVRGTS